MQRLHTDISRFIFELQVIHQSVESYKRRRVQPPVATAKSIINLLIKTADTYLSIFHGEFHLYYLDAAIRCYQVAISFSNQINKPPSFYLQLSLFATCEERAFFATPESERYVQSMTHFKNRKRIHEPVMFALETENDDHLFEEPDTKRLRIE